MLYSVRTVHCGRKHSRYVYVGFLGDVLEVLKFLQTSPWQSEALKAAKAERPPELNWFYLKPRSKKRKTCLGKPEGQARQRPRTIAGIKVNFSHHFELNSGLCGLRVSRGWSQQKKQSGYFSSSSPPLSLSPLLQQRWHKAAAAVWSLAHLRIWSGGGGWESSLARSLHPSMTSCRQIFLKESCKKEAIKFDVMVIAFSSGRLALLDLLEMSHVQLCLPSSQVDPEEEAEGGDDEGCSSCWFSACCENEGPGRPPFRPTLRFAKTFIAPKI